MRDGVSGEEGRGRFERCSAIYRWFLFGAPVLNCSHPTLHPFRTLARIYSIDSKFFYFNPYIFITLNENWRTPPLRRREKGISLSEYCSAFYRSALRKRGRVGGGLVKRMQGKEICFDNNIIKRNAVLALRDVPKNTFSEDLQNFAFVT